MAGRLDGKVLLISGATGMAAATACLAAGEGARLFVVSLNAEDCQALASRSGCQWLAGDLRQGGLAEAAVARCVETFGRIDALYNVAGISGRSHGDGPLHECTDEGWEVTLDANLTTMFRLSRAALRQMLAQPIAAGGLRGVILNMASVTAFSPRPDYFATHAYAAAKGAIIALTKAMASFYAPHLVRVNAIAPGLVRTPMSQLAQSDDRILELMRSKQPLSGTLIEPDDIARVSVFLLSDDSRMMTGDVVTVDAGWSVS